MIFSMFLTDLRRSSSSRKVAMLRTWANETVALGCAEAVRRTARVKSDMGGYLEDISKIFQKPDNHGRVFPRLLTMMTIG